MMRDRSSGTTGEPKGAMHTANTLLSKARLASELFSLTDDDVIFMGSPLAHQTGFLFGVVLPLSFGGRTVFMDIWEPDTAVRLIAQERSDGSSDVGGGQRRRGHLVEQGLEEVVVASVDEHHIDGGIRQCARSSQAPESASDDHDTMSHWASRGSWTYL